MAAAGLVTTLLTFSALVCAGAVMRVTGLLKPEDSRPLNAVIVYLGLPAFIFRAVHGARIDSSAWAVIAVAWCVFGVTLALAYVVQRVMRMPRPRAGGFMLAAALGNTGFIGYPLAASALGASAVPLAVFSDVFGTVFAVVVVGVPIAARYGAHGLKPPHPIRELLTFPAVIALALGLLMRPVELPTAVSSGLDLLATVVAPLIMISVGLSLRPRTAADGAGALAALTVLKLLVAPMVALLVGSALLEGLPLGVAVLQASMPAMMLTVVVGERFGLDKDFIASAIFVTTVLSAVTIPLVGAAAL